MLWLFLYCKGNFLVCGMGTVPCSIITTTTSHPFSHSKQTQFKRIPHPFFHKLYNILNIVQLHQNNVWLLLQPNQWNNENGILISKKHLYGSCQFRLPLGSMGLWDINRCSKSIYNYVYLSISPHPEKYHYLRSSKDEIVPIY